MNRADSRDALKDHPEHLMTWTLRFSRKNDDSRCKWTWVQIAALLNFQHYERDKAFNSFFFFLDSSLCFRDRNNNTDLAEVG